MSSATVYSHENNQTQLYRFRSVIISRLNWYQHATSQTEKQTHVARKLLQTFTSHAVNKIYFHP